ncbi:MAG: transcription termination/antitermination protein NusA [Oscillospiraceae bacterium]|nr:transcription termination/antitermination protein NusA [Oscillospiraceae bacterium]
MNEGFFEALAALGSENSVEQALLVEKIEAAMLKAAQKAYPYAEDDDIRVEIIPSEHRFDIYMKKSVVEGEPKTDYEVSYEQAKLYDPDCELGDLVECKLDPVKFGRSIAQFAKQAIRGDLRAINRQQMMEKFESKEREIITVKVTQIDPLRGTVTVEYDHTELYLSRNEQLFTETMVDGKPVRVYEPLKEGQLIKVFVTTIANRDKKPIVRISRVDRGFVEKLFEQAIPEIADGTVEIHAVSREAGFRSKIAVSSNDPNVDAVGTCIGPHSSRINTVLNELHGEKIDIIPYSDDPEEFITRALAPATVISTTLADDGTRAATVIVPNDQLSLAIGNKGQNAKLAAKLTGYKIDIKSEFPDPEPESDDVDAEGYEILEDAAELDQLDGSSAEV